jgi:hypothetical protein
MPRKATVTRETPAAADLDVFEAVGGEQSTRLQGQGGRRLSGLAFRFGRCLDDLDDDPWNERRTKCYKRRSCDNLVTKGRKVVHH